MRRDFPDIPLDAAAGIASNDPIRVKFLYVHVCGCHDEATLVSIDPAPRTTRVYFTSRCQPHFIETFERLHLQVHVSGT